MSQRSYRFAPPAEADLAEHGNYLLTAVSEAAMMSFLRNLYRTCDLLASLPYIGQQTEDYPDLREFGVRGSYGVRLVYRVLPEAIEIVRAVSRNQHWIP